jgi:hypothetical protein
MFPRQWNEREKFFLEKVSVERYSSKDVTECGLVTVSNKGVISTHERKRKLSRRGIIKIDSLL